MKRYLLLAAIGVVVFVVINVVQLVLQSPQEADQLEIAKCWEESKGATLTVEKRQIVIGACHMLEKAFQLNYGTTPVPRGSKDT